MTYIPVPIRLIALFIFAYMRNTVAKRNDAKRQRLWDKEDRILKMLQEKHNK